mgnify:CR=1 FL=1
MSAVPVLLDSERKLDAKWFHLRDDYLLLNAITNAYRDNTSVLVGIVADPHSVYLRGNGKTSYALHVAAAWYKYYVGMKTKRAWCKALESIVFSLNELRERIDSTSRSDIIIADDIGRWFSPKPSYSNEERKIFEVLETFRLNCVALIWTAVTPRSVPSKILIHSDYMVYVSKVKDRYSKAEVWRAIIDKSRPYKEPKFAYLAEESFPTYYPDEIHQEYNRRRIERFKFTKNNT